MNTHALHDWGPVQPGEIGGGGPSGVYRLANSSSEEEIGLTGFHAEVAGILEDVRRSMERNPEGARAAAERLVTLLARSAEAGFAVARGGLAPWQKRKIDRYLREHLEEPVYTDEIAAQVSLSVSHFCRVFKESFGTSPHMYIVRLRLAKAQQMMLATDEPLSQIALACGLADQSHLTKLFRSELGETPGAWRRRNLSDAEAEARRCHARTRRPISAPVPGAGCITQ